MLALGTTHSFYTYIAEEVIEYIKQTVEEERERNAENRTALEAELAEARRSSQQLAQLSAIRMQLQHDSATERPVGLHHQVYLSSRF